MWHWYSSTWMWLKFSTEFSDNHQQIHKDPTNSTLWPNKLNYTTCVRTRTRITTKNPSITGVKDSDYSDYPVWMCHLPPPCIHMTHTPSGRCNWRCYWPLCSLLSFPWCLIQTTVSFCNKSFSLIQQNDWSDWDMPNIPDVTPLP